MIDDVLRRVGDLLSAGPSRFTPAEQLRNAIRLVTNGDALAEREVVAAVSSTGFSFEDKAAMFSDTQKAITDALRRSRT